MLNYCKDSWEMIWTLFQQIPLYHPIWRVSASLGLEEWIRPWKRSSSTSPSRFPQAYQHATFPSWQPIIKLMAKMNNLYSNANICLAKVWRFRRLLFFSGIIKIAITHYYTIAMAVIASSTTRMAWIFTSKSTTVLTMLILSIGSNNKSLHSPVAMIHQDNDTLMDIAIITSILNKSRSPQLNKSPLIAYTIVNNNLR